MHETKTIPKGAGGFQPEPEAWSRYGPLVEATLKTIEAAARKAPAVSVPQPISKPKRTADFHSQDGAPTGYSSRGWDDLVDLIADLTTGEISVKAELERALALISAKDRELCAVIEVEADRALQQAAELEAQPPTSRGLLAGAPYARKDLFFRAGCLVESGSVMFRGRVASETATVLKRLDAAGGIDIGRLSMAELAMSPTGFNVHDEHPRNPWNPKFVPGGSSSGSGVAVAAGYVRATLGTDTGGSVRHPAAMSGVTGLKPTANRISRAGLAPLAWSLDCVGPLAPSARDCGLLLEIMSGPDDRDGTVVAPKFRRPVLTWDLSGTRIAVPAGYYFETLTPAVSTALDDALATLKKAGAEIISTDAPDMATVNTMAHIVLVAEACSLFGDSFRDPDCSIGRQVRDRLEPGLFYSADNYANALRLRPGIRAAWLDAAIADCDAVFIPAIPKEVPTIAETTEGDPAEISTRIGALTHATRGINYLGLPSLSLPCGFDGNGLPIAFQLVGHADDEATLIQIGDAYQQATDWHTRRPMERTQS